MKTTADATISVEQLTAKFKTWQLYTQLLEYIRQGNNRIRLVASCRWALRTYFTLFLMFIIITVIVLIKIIPTQNRRELPFRRIFLKTRTLFRLSMYTVKNERKTVINCYTVLEKKIQQCFATHIVQCCQQYCSALLHLIQAQRTTNKLTAKHCHML